MHNTSTLEDLLAAHDDVRLGAYRKALGALTTRGVRATRTAAGFELADVDRVMSVKYPAYVSMDAAMQENVTKVREALTRCGIAEYVAAVTGAKGDRSQLSDAASELKSALAKYETLAKFQHVITSVRRCAAEDAASSARAKAQEAHTAALAQASQSTDDASRDAHARDAMDARKSFKSHADQRGEAASLPVVVERLPDIDDESVQRRKKRDRVVQRNAKVAARVNNTRVKPKANGKGSGRNRK